MQLNDFNFELPANLIARYPLMKRSASRLLCLNDHKGIIRHQQFSDIIHYLEDGDLLIFNDTKVIPARLIGNKSTGGKVEVLIERILDNHRILAQVRASKVPRLGDYLLFHPYIQLEIVQRHHHEACVDEMHRRMFRSTDVHTDRHPFLFECRIDEVLLIILHQISEIVEA